MKRFLTSIFGVQSKKAQAKARKVKNLRTRLAVESLEDRVLMHGNLDLGGPHDPAFTDHAHLESSIGNTIFTPPPVGFVATAVPISQVPAYSSKPGAPATVYLDFNGHYQKCWGKLVFSPDHGFHCGGISNAPANDIKTPAFNLYGSDPNTFDDAELAMIKAVWQRVAEDFAPFNVNVTTVAPSSIDNGEELRVAIGGANTDWYGSGGGVAMVGSFTSDYANIVYVFSEHFYSPKTMADAVSHETGHSFGLWHQSTFDSSGQKTEEYNDNCTGPASDPDNCTSPTAPIMGNSYQADRSLWWSGKDSYGNWQNDMAILDGLLGYRADESGVFYSTASPLRLVGSGLNGSGVIATHTDKDYFSFNTYGGQMSLQFNVAAVGANLDAKLSLYKQVVKKKGLPSYSFVTSIDPAAGMGATWNVNVSSGKYFVVVASQGYYGDVGQYTITGTAPAGVPVTHTGPIVVASQSSTAMSSTTTSQGIKPAAPCCAAPRGASATTTDQRVFNLLPEWFQDKLHRHDHDAILVAVLSDLEGLMAEAHLSDLIG